MDPQEGRYPLSANAELVRSILAAWEQGDYGHAEWAHPAIEYLIADGPSPGRWTGLVGMVEGARANLDWTSPASDDTLI